MASLHVCAVCALPERERVRLVATGEVDLSTVGLLRDEVADLLTAGRQDLVIDLRGVTFADTQAIHLLVDVTEQVWLAGGSLTIRVAPGPMTDLLAITGISTSLPITFPASAA
jgi:anti-sigma B factor antagonist